MRRFGAGEVALLAGAALLALAVALPWISIPGGELQRGLMLQRGEPIPATGAAWTSLPVTAVSLGILIVAAVVTAFVAGTPRRVQPPAAAVTAAAALLVLVVAIDKLFVGRVSADYTAIGAGGYLGVGAVVLIGLGAVAVIREARPGPRRLEQRKRASPRPAADHSLAAPTPTEPRSAEDRRRSRARAGLAGAALATVYLASRISFADRLPYFLDEGTWASFADQVAGSTSKLFATFEFAQGPLPVWLGAVWIQLGFEPLTAMRMVSVTAGLLTVVAVGLLARNLFGSAAGWVAAALCVVLPFFLVHDGIGIYEPLVTLVMAGALLLQILLARRPDLRIGALLGLVLAAGLLTKQNALPALLLLPLSLLCFDWSEADRRRRLRTWLLAIGIVVVLVAAAEWWQRSSSYWDDRNAAMEDILLWPARSVGDVLDDPFGVFGQNWDTYWPALLGYVTAPLLATTLVGAWLLLRRQPRLALLLLAWILVPFMIGMAFQLRPYPRHAMFLMPPAIVLSAYAIVWGARFAERRMSRPAAVAACSAAAALLIAPALVLDARVLARPATAEYPGLDYWQYVAGWPGGRPWSGAADQIESRATGPRVVIATPGGSYSVLRQLLGDDDRYVFAPVGSRAADRAQFGLFDTSGFPVKTRGFEARMARRGFIETARFTRPSEPCSGPRERGCGGAVVVLERG